MTKLAFWLRVASIVSLLFAAGHTLGGRNAWAPVDSPALDVMRSSSFAVEGVTRTYFDFYRGFGWSLSVFMLLQAIVLWQLAALAAVAHGAIVRPIVAAFTGASGGIAAISWAFILPVSTIFSVVLTACLAVAYWMAPRSALSNGGEAVTTSRAAAAPRASA